MPGPFDYNTQPVNALGSYLGGAQARQAQVEGENRNALLKMQQAAAQQQQAQGADKAQVERQRALEADVIAAAKWADTPGKWNQAVDHYERDLGIKEAAQYRDRFELRDMLLARAQQAEQPQTPETFGAPVATEGGFVQFGNRGTPKPTGYKPAPTAGNMSDADLSPEGLDLAAETYRTTGKLPTGLYRNKTALVRVIGRAAELAKAQGDDAKATVLGQQAFSASKGALTAISRQEAMVGAFEKTALKNLLLARDLGRKVDRTGSPIVNKALLAFRQGVTGDPETAAFVNALVAARTEYAKVLSGATGAQGITDSARHEAEDLFSKATNQEALERIMQVAEQEMANRMASFREQKAELQRNMGGQAPEHASEVTPDVQALLDKYK